MKPPRQLEEIELSGNISVSHIGLFNVEPEVTMFALFGSLVSETMEDINIMCSFSQLNDLLSLTMNGAEEATEKLAAMLSIDVNQEFTIDLTADGGLHFFDVLFCLERVSTAGPFYNKNDVPGYVIRGIISEAPAMAAFREAIQPIDTTLPADKTLIISYAFYLHFVAEGCDEYEARRLSRLSDEDSFNQAKGLWK